MYSMEPALDEPLDPYHQNYNKHQYQLVPCSPDGKMLARWHTAVPRQGNHHNKIFNKVLLIRPCLFYGRCSRPRFFKFGGRSQKEITCILI